MSKASVENNAKSVMGERRRMTRRMEDERRLTNLKCYLKGFYVLKIKEEKCNMKKTDYQFKFLQKDNYPRFTSLPGPSCGLSLLQARALCLILP